ncbi:sensor domain-containing diguanylate cyclase [Paenibacillus sp. NFR01]|uniref:sensor domain-containing diguanylate cyclase n=1 Tax=Paenibacillus sp. NFR01 TaxID=1566279 RepID=UPI0008B0A002|nr:sensor domain-containing diguanylate cyclase [Paenibacillus sp. NFR01]SET87641.1 PAS domain S-box-containing protein/diguanylate cyclase (GGDEF) domain-containing protein [Paenibacillus sp. NFR01]
MAGSKINNTRRVILVFASITVLLTGISIASLLYLNAAMNKLAGTLSGVVNRNTELILNADRDLYRSASAYQHALNPNASGSKRRQSAAEYEQYLSGVERQLRLAADNIAVLKLPYGDMEQGRELLTALEQELQNVENSFGTWAADGRSVLAAASGNPADAGADTPQSASSSLATVRSHLDETESLLDSYARHVLSVYEEKKSSVFAVYSLLLFLLVLVIVYLCRRLISLQNEIREEKSLHQLIGETMSDFIIVTDINGLILYASPSHAAVLGYVPEKGAPLSNYIREAEISWAKLKSVVRGTPRISELRMRSAEGQWIWLETKVTPIQGSRSFPAQFMLVSREITQRKMYEERLHKLAFYDHLTAIPNRAHFKMYMENMINQPEDRRQDLALALLDCDRFKQLNDTLGHLAGDEFLQLLSRELQQTVKGYGQAFRIGGDEFAVVFHRYANSEMLEEVLERLLQLFKKSWSVSGGASFNTSASIGVALFPQHGTSINELLRAADLAMYRSKNHGGNEANLYNELIDEAVAEQPK